MKRTCAASCVWTLLLLLPCGLVAQTHAALPERAVRRDIPLTNMIRRAHQAGTRDSTGAPGPSYWQLEVDYSIDASLDPGQGTVTASETVTIHNNSPDALDRIVLRLDQNVFAPEATRSRRLIALTEGTTVSSIVVDGREIDFNARPPRRQPGEPPPPLTEDLVLGLNTTSAQIALLEPIPAGGQGTLEIDWSFRIQPAVGGRGLRHGAWGDSLFQVAQWYPQVAKYDDLRGWDSEPYLGSSEFYNNYGAFDVRIDVPAGWVVGATGVLQNPEEVLSEQTRERFAQVVGSDETRTIVGVEDFGPGRATAAGDRLVWHFSADYVNDFAWATSDQFVWQATGIEIPGEGRIPFSWMYLPGSARAFEGADARGRHSLQFYSKLWMPYAFPQLTMVDGPDRGMEYPMFIMSALGAQDHEIGHEWWPMMVGTNETWYGFMDEGFTSYMGVLSRQARSGQPYDMDGRGQSYGNISGDEREGPLMWNANYGGPMYGFQAYTKAGMMLSMLGGVVGDEEVWRAMSEYAQAWRFKHPSPWDYMFFMNESLGQDLGWFWNYWLFTTESVDGSIAQVVANGEGTKVVVRQDGQMPSPVVLRFAFRGEPPAIAGVPNAKLSAEGHVTVTYPVDVWFAGSRTFEAEFPFSIADIEAVTLDPHGRFPDRDPGDNVWPRPAGM